MADKFETGIIKKICVGDPKKGMHYSLGQVAVRGTVAEGIVTAIREDVANFIHFGVKSYVVIVKPNDDNYPEFVWRRYENQPVDIVYKAQKIQ